MPTIEKLHKEWKNKGLVLMGIDDEDADVVRQYYAKNSLSFPTLIDSSRAVREHYGVEGIPTSVVIDRKGRLTTQVTGTRTEEQFLTLLHKAGL